MEVDEVEAEDESFGEETEVEAEDESHGEETEVEAEEEDENHEEEAEEEDKKHEEEEAEDEDKNDYFKLLDNLSSKWLSAQLTHHVSATAANVFWDIGMKQIPILMTIKSQNSVTRKTPKFSHERRKLYEHKCPPIHMRFGFKHKVTGAIETVDCNSAPSNRFQRNPDYLKIYEEAHVKVISNIYIYRVKLYG